MCDFSKHKIENKIEKKFALNVPRKKIKTGTTPIVQWGLGRKERTKISNPTDVVGENSMVSNRLNL